MQLTFDADVEAFRARVQRVPRRVPAGRGRGSRASRSSADVPEWARRWQRLQFDHGWLLPGNPPEFGGRNATILQQYVHREELSQATYLSELQSAGLGIIAASLLSSAPTSRSSVGGADPASRDHRCAGHE